ncbi:TPA: DUF2158 domain-containing protein [Pseudomonas aeruginosa]|uniref:DUF2158 domain-containing protein n=1 Tax=Pseudomonas aeruginosa TaxID=287 RepID=UPI003983045C|nr:YodC family protein [Pseudomonas aeruginosa]HCF5316078.1 YodC family protein [Pseudomonas aeruginosa]
MSLADGATVQLKSGGPVMTVKYGDVDQRNGKVYVRCQWFNEAGVLQEEMFYEDSLKTIDVS